MSVLWAGGEDIDFPNGAAITVSTSASNFRAGYARCSVGGSAVAQVDKSTVFPGGAVTSCWMSARFNFSAGGSTNQRTIGLCLGSTTASGLYVGYGASSKLALIKYDGTTTTVLASESGTSLPTSTTIRRVDMQLVNYGVSATVNVYLDGVLLIAFSGDVTVSGVTAVDSVFITQSGNFSFNWSEIVIATDDTRAWPGLVTLALTGAGTTNNWTNNTFSNINGTTISDANPASVNTTAQDQQYNVSDLPAGSFVVAAVKISARMAESATPAVTQVKLGYNSAGSVAFGTGATKALTTAYATYEQLDVTNPVTSAAWAQSDINGLQLDMRSLT